MLVLPNTTVAIGDVQGCHGNLLKLLDLIPEDAPLVFLGDIVNRGPASLAALRLVRRLCLEGRAHAVLGNHDLHLLACVATGTPPKKRDTIAEILEAPDADDLIDWLRRLPLVIDTNLALFVHAGILPHWDLPTTLRLASEIESQLQSKDWKASLQAMYGDDQFNPTLSGAARLRALLNVFTRLRFLDAEGNPDYALKEGNAAAPAGYRPWFETSLALGKRVCFGHWSMLGLVIRPQALAVDTGCLWGGALSGVRLSDNTLFQTPCPMWAKPGK